MSFLYFKAKSHHVMIFQIDFVCHRLSINPYSLVLIYQSRNMCMKNNFLETHVIPKSTFRQCYFEIIYMSEMRTSYALPFSTHRCFENQKRIFLNRTVTVLYVIWQHFNARWYRWDAKQANSKSTTTTE